MYYKGRVIARVLRVRILCAVGLIIYVLLSSATLYTYRDRDDGVNNIRTIKYKEYYTQAYSGSNKQTSSPDCPAIHKKPNEP